MPPTIPGTGLFLGCFALQAAYKFSAMIVTKIKPIANSSGIPLELAIRKTTMLKKKAAAHKAAPKKEEPKKAQSGGARALESFNLSRAKAVVSEGGKSREVKYYLKRGSNREMIGVPGGKLVCLSDWLEGKAQL